MVAQTLALSFAIPLSPPHSPPMSDTGYKSEEHSLQQAISSSNLGSWESKPAVEAKLREEVSESPSVVDVNTIQQARPPLRSYKSFPYSLGPSSRAQDEAHQDTSETSAFSDFAERVLSSGPQPTASAGLQQPTFGGSAPTSPVGQLSPRSARAEEHDAQMDDEDIELGDIEEEDSMNEKRPMTAAELRAHKRKMKRFRLTHNQTRFLMSEFARQAHPDAAHRERLSREIPGLSPRQVQVWFQNRRAKLKRLTTDDRERMMRSRALPADFDTTQALHSPFSTPNPSMTAPVMSTATFPPFNNGTGAGPLSLDTTRRASEYETYYPKYPSTSTVRPAMAAGLAFTPPQSATETMSPGSAASRVSSFNFQTQESPGRASMGLPYGGQGNFAYNSSAMPPRLQIHDRITRAGGDVASSPLRASMSYGVGADIVSETRPSRSTSFSDHAYTHERPQRSRSTTASSVTGSGPYGLGFSYSALSMYPQVDANRPSPMTQPSVDLQQPRRSSRQLAGPPITYPQYPSANLSTSQVSQYTNFSAGYISSSFQNPYSYQNNMSNQQLTENQNSMPQQSQQSYAPVQPSQQHLLPFSGTAGQQEEHGDNDDSSIPLNLNY